MCCKSRERRGHSPGDSVAVHSLAVSGENTLKERSQHFAQGCMETVKRKKRKQTGKEGWLFIEQKMYSAQSLVISLKDFTPDITALPYLLIMLGESIFTWVLSTVQR